MVIKEEKWLLHPGWELYDTWLIFYDTLPAYIPAFDLSRVEQNIANGNAQPLHRPRAYQYLENLDILPVFDANQQAYSSVINMFLKSGFRIVDIHYDTLNNI